jgi:transcriptional regulator with PAS, ATPase and Fis domain
VASVSPTLATTLWRLRRLARSAGEILICGETGSGKEVYARAVHRASGRTGRFVAVNCAAIPTELAESELFGYARGAHSTAREGKPGLVNLAHGGTLFLDEIGDMSPALQAKLLRFLQDREVTPLGSTTTTRVDVLVVAATHQDGLMAAGGPLRMDLAARLGAQPIAIPPLRDRIEDLGALLHHLLAPTGLREIEPGAFHALCLYEWPRNVRELEKVIGEVVAVSDGEPKLTLAHLPAMVTSVMGRGRTPDAAAGTRRSAPTRDELEALLREHDGNVSQVARTLGRQWAVVWRWLVKHQIDPGKYRK